MSNITELTAKLKAAALKAKSATEDYAAGRISITTCYSECAEFNSLTDGPDQILPLTEALEAAEKRNTGLHHLLSRYSMSAGQADQRMAESRAVRDALGFGKDAVDVAPIDLLAAIDGMKVRIAELEARTLTVKLPGAWCDWIHEADTIAAIKAACAGAGIKLQIEGE